MPLVNGKDKKGSYWMWGTHGKKYYYRPGSMISRHNAKRKAIAQAVAITYSQVRGKRKYMTRMRA